MSWMKDHRTICATIEEIKSLASTRNEQDIVDLCNEAKDYAQRMSAKLIEYKKKELR